MTLKQLIADTFNINCKCVFLLKPVFMFDNKFDKLTVLDMDVLQIVIVNDKMQTYWFMHDKFVPQEPVGYNLRGQAGYIKNSVDVKVLDVVGSLPSYFQKYLNDKTHILKYEEPSV